MNFVRFVKTCRDLKAGESLNFALGFATGSFISYLGDDDLIIDDRFDIIDDITKSNSDVELICGSLIRFELNEDFGVDKLSYNEFNDSNVGILPVSKFSCLNMLSIPAGGSFVISRKLYERIYNLYGYYSSQQGVEFFILRNAMILSYKTILINKPLLLMGRTNLSVGSIAFNNKLGSPEFYRWNDDFEYTDSINYSFVTYKGYVPISNDAAIEVASKLGLVDLIDNRVWCRYFIADLFGLVSKKKMDIFHAVKLFITSKFKLRLKVYGLIYAIYFSYRRKFIVIKFNKRHELELYFNEKVYFEQFISSNFLFKHIIN